MNLSRWIGAFLLCVAAGAALAAPVRIASWNLGWHVAQAEVPAWIARCGLPYVRSAAGGVWKPVAPGTPGATIGWFIEESRARLEGVDLATMPPCGVYRTPAFDNVAVTAAAFAQRSRQLAAFIRDEIRPDLIAFQEVSGRAAVAEALGSAASDYEICSFDGRFKVQRLAFAWRKSVATLAEPCTAVAPVALPDLPQAEQLRPGLQVGLDIGGRRVRLFTVHLKSGCVSPLDGGQLDSPRARGGACAALQRQVRPLEAALESLAGADHVVVLGDFNRNLWHEQHQVIGARAVRSDGTTDLERPLPAGVTTQNLLREVNDAEPAGSQLTLLPMTCGGAMDALCQASTTRRLTKQDGQALAGVSGLGCRNGVGLDHVLVSTSLAPRAREVAKLPLGQFGRTLEPRAGKPDALLALSDHCPIVATFDLP